MTSSRMSAKADTRLGGRLADSAERVAQIIGEVTGVRSDDAPRMSELPLAASQWDRIHAGRSASHGLVGTGASYPRHQSAAGQPLAMPGAGLPRACCTQPTRPRSASTRSAASATVSRLLGQMLLRRAPSDPDVSASSILASIDRPGCGHGCDCQRAVLPERDLANRRVDRPSPLDGETHALVVETRSDGPAPLVDATVGEGPSSLAYT